ncbi:MAG: hypothetical protein JNM14_05925 [Ferruginibacter sp.]|nr:hypothetical protein [Ferruginibacter sp.]
MSKLLSMCLLIFISVCTQAQNTYPPALGPFEVQENDPAVSELPGSLVTGELTRVLNDSVLPEINQQLPENITITYTLKQLKPHLTQTRYNNAPNEKFVKMGYEIVYNIKYNNQVLRRLKHTINVNVFCNGWSNPSGGQLDIRAYAPTPVLLEPSFAEQALNIASELFTFGQFSLSEKISDYIKSLLPPAVNRRFAIQGFNYRFNCLGLQAGPKGGDGLYQDAAILIKMKRLPVSPEFKGVTVKLKKIKRLNARNFNNNVLYKPSEDIYLNFFANSEETSFLFENFREGEERIFPDNKMVILNPLDYGKLVAITQIAQADSFTEDAAFEVYNAENNFGHGLQKIIVKKPYNIPPQSLPNGNRSKPTTGYADAYEISFEVASRVNTPPAQLGN